MRARDARSNDRTQSVTERAAKRAAEPLFHPNSSHNLPLLRGFASNRRRSLAHRNWHFEPVRQCVGSVMNSLFKPADALVGDKARAMHALWEKLRGSRLAPKREEITLAKVRTLAPWMWIIDVVEDGADFRFRQAGDRVVQFLGAGRPGFLLSKLSAGPFADLMGRTLNHCVEVKRPVALGPARSIYAGKEHWETETVVLPLSEDGEKVTALLGTMEYWPLGTKSGER